MMFASPQVAKRLLPAEEESESTEAYTEGSAGTENPCLYVACWEGLKSMGVDVRRNKAYGDGEMETKEMVGSFGRPLAELCVDGVDVPQGRVPRILHRLVSLLDDESVLRTEFIFRVSGALVRVNNSKATIEKEEFNSMPPHDIAGLLKMFLRELPVGMLNSAYASFVSVPKVEEVLWPRALQLACGLLPKESRDSLKYLMAFLARVASFSAANKMDAHNLALLLAPNILYNPNKMARLDEARIAQEKNAVETVKMLILKPELIGVLPGDIHAIAAAMDPEEARKRYTEHTHPRKRRSSIQKMLRLVGDAGSSVRHAFSTRLLQHTSAGAAAVSALPDAPRPNSPLATSASLATVSMAAAAAVVTPGRRGLARTASEKSPIVASIVSKTPLPHPPPVPHPPAAVAVKRKSAAELTPARRTPSHSQHRAAKAASQQVFDPRRAKENAPAAILSIKDAIEREVYDSSSESPSKRFRNVAAMATHKEADPLECSETPKCVQTRSATRRRSLQPEGGSPAIRRMSLDTSGEAEVFVALDGRDQAMFGFTHKRSASLAKVPDNVTTTTPRHGAIGKVSRTPSKASSGDCSWV